MDKNKNLNFQFSVLCTTPHGLPIAPKLSKCFTIRSAEGWLVLGTVGHPSAVVASQGWQRTAHPPGMSILRRLQLEGGGSSLHQNSRCDCCLAQGLSSGAKYLALCC